NAFPLLLVGCSSLDFMTASPVYEHEHFPVWRRHPACAFRKVPPERRQDARATRRERAPVVQCGRRVFQSLRSMTVGESCSASTFTRNLWPSALTSYARLAGRTLTGKRTCGWPKSRASAFSLTLATSRCPERSMKKTSFPSARQRGKPPPFADTCHFKSGFARESAKTSARPFSFEAYASHFPLGDTTGRAAANPGGVIATGFHGPSIATRSIAF